MKYLSRVFGLLFLLILLVPSSTVTGQEAREPSVWGMTPYDFHISGTEITEENVTIEVVDPGLASATIRARVTAEYTVNNDSAITTDRVYGFDNTIPDLTTLVIRINGAIVPFSVGDNSGYGENVVFRYPYPANSDSLVRITYQLEEPVEERFGTLVSFVYLHDEQVWGGRTRVQIVVKFPYALSQMNVISPGEGSNRSSPLLQLIGREAQWQVTVRNHTRYELWFIRPATWHRILAELENVENDPRDGEAWGRLGKLYKSISVNAYLPDDVRDLYYVLSDEAYRQAVGLLPQDAQWHAGYAELLANSAAFCPACGDPQDNLVRALEELHSALVLAPHDLIVIRIASEIAAWYPDLVIPDGNGAYVVQVPMARPGGTFAPTVMPVLPRGSSTPTWHPARTSAWPTFTIGPNILPPTYTRLPTRTPPGEPGTAAVSTTPVAPAAPEPTQMPILAVWGIGVVTVVLVLWLLRKRRPG